jgi:hypothetical protein
MCRVISMYPAGNSAIGDNHISLYLRPLTALKSNEMMELTVTLINTNPSDSFSRGKVMRC